MAKKAVAKPSPETTTTADAARGAPVIRSAEAPFLYFENASAYGHLSGVIQVTLEAAGLIPTTEGQPATFERVIVAHLRMNIPAAKALRSALDGALFLASPAESQAKN